MSVLSLFSSLRSDDVAVTVVGAHVCRPAADQLHAAVCAAVHQGLVPLHTTLGPNAQCFRRRLHSLGRYGTAISHKDISIRVTGDDIG